MTIDQGYISQNIYSCQVNRSGEEKRSEGELRGHTVIEEINNAPRLQVIEKVNGSANLFRGPPNEPDPIKAVKWLRKKLQKYNGTVLGKGLLDNLGFIMDPKRIPFKYACRIDSSQIQKIQQNEQVPWAEQFRACRAMLAKQLKSFSDWTVREKATACPADPRVPLYDLAEKVQTPSSARLHGIELIKTVKGCGGAYFCKHKGKRSRLKAIIKTVNGDVGSIDNPAGILHPFMHSYIRPTANYESVQKEALAYELSLALGCQGTVPPTILAVIESEKFHNFFENPAVKTYLDACPPKIRSEVIKLLGGPANPKRLCSIQQVVDNSLRLGDLILSWGLSGYPENPFNQESFEDAIHMTRTLGETDGHMDNYLVVVKEAQYHIVKIDSGFALPKGTRGAINCLTALPNAKHPLSERYRQKVLSSNPQALEALGNKYCLLEEEIESGKERMHFMKDLVRTWPFITHRETELRLRLFSGAGYEERLKGDMSYSSRSRFALEVYTPAQLKELKRINRAVFAATDSADPLKQVQGGGLVKTARPWKLDRKLKKARQQVSGCKALLEEIHKEIRSKQIGHTLSERVNEVLSAWKELVDGTLNSMRNLQTNIKFIHHRCPEDFEKIYNSYLKKESRRIFDTLAGLESNLLAVLKTWTQSNTNEELIETLHNADRITPSPAAGNDSERMKANREFPIDFGY